MIYGWGISCEIALRLMSLDLTDDMSTLVQVMAQWVKYSLFVYWWTTTLLDLSIYCTAQIPYPFYWDYNPLTNNMMFLVEKWLYTMPVLTIGQLHIALYIITLYNR